MRGLGRDVLGGIKASRVRGKNHYFLQQSQMEISQKMSLLVIVLFICAAECSAAPSFDGTVGKSAGELEELAAAEWWASVEAKGLPNSVTIIDSDDANLYLKETLSQIIFLHEKGDINETTAFRMFFEQPIAKALLVGNLEEALPEGCVLADYYDVTECVEEDAELTKQHIIEKRSPFSIIVNFFRMLLPHVRQVNYRVFGAIRTTLQRAGYARGSYGYTRFGSVRAGNGVMTNWGSTSSIGSTSTLRARVWKGLKQTAKYAAIGGVLTGATYAMDQIVKSASSDDSLENTLILVQNKTEEMQDFAEDLDQKTNETLSDIKHGLVQIANEAFNRTSYELEALKDEVAVMLIDVVKQVAKLQPEIQKQINSLKNDFEILQNGGPPRTDFSAPSPQVIDYEIKFPPKKPASSAPIEVLVLPTEEIAPPKTSRTTPIFPIYVFVSIAAGILLCALTYATKQIIGIVRMRPLDNNYDEIQ